MGQRQGSPLAVTDYLSSIVQVPAEVRIRYGDAAPQWFDLYRPSGTDRVPVVVLVHGGCWSLVPAETLSPNAADLAAHGVAVCNLEYRRIGEEGGGYPGTYLDIAAGLDRLRGEAETYGLDLTRVVVAGHSSGGQLALWLGSRGKLPTGSPLHMPDPLPVRSVVVIASGGNLRRFADLLAITCRGMSTVDQVVGLPSPDRPDPFSDTSAAEMLPTGVRTVSITGVLDDNWPPHVAADWVDAARAAGDDAEEIYIPDVGHFEIVDTRYPAWAAVRDCILAEVARL